LGGCSRQAANDRVRELAQRMIDDHTRMEEEVMQLVHDKGLSLDDQPAPVSSSDFSRLARMDDGTSTVNTSAK